MKMTVEFYDFQRAFKDMNCNNFSYEGLRVLFDYFNDDDFNDYELDVIGLCCDYTEATPIEIADMYDIECDLSDLDSVSASEILSFYVKKYLDHHTMLIGETSNNTIVFQNF